MKRFFKTLCLFSLALFAVTIPRQQAKVVSAADIAAYVNNVYDASVTEEQAQAILTEWEQHPDYKLAIYFQVTSVERFTAALAPDVSVSNGKIYFTPTWYRLANLYLDGSGGIENWQTISSNGSATLNDTMAVPYLIFEAPEEFETEPDFSGAVYSENMGHLVGVDRGFKRYILDGVDYMELSWFSETSGGFELLDELYWDDAFIKISMIPRGVYQNMNNKKLSNFPSLTTSSYLYSLRSRYDDFPDIFDNFLNVRINIDALYAEDGCLYDWYQSFLEARPTPHIFYSMWSYVDIYLTPFVYVDGDLYYGDSVCIADKSTVSQPNNFTVTYGTVSFADSPSGETYETFIPVSTAVSYDYSIGEGKTYSEAIIDASTRNSGYSQDISTYSTQWVSFLQETTSAIGAVPQFFATVFYFLPSYVIGTIGATIAAMGFIALFKFLLNTFSSGGGIGG